jgi:hypothetical protein
MLRLANLKKLKDEIGEAIAAAMANADATRQHT